MNTNLQINDPARIKETLCQHFNMPAAGSHLTGFERSFPTLRGNGKELRYYHFTLTDGHGNVKRHAFGKLGGPNAREYQALQYLRQNIQDENGFFSNPIALLKDGERCMLLLEYLEGYSNAFTMLHSLSLLPNRASNVTRLGKNILDKVYGLQQHFPVIFRPLSSADTDTTPGQPLPTSVFQQLKEIKSLSPQARIAIGDRINAILQRKTMVRRGVIHGQLGMRNVMLSRSDISFIDWEYMQSEGLCLYDPCYIATMALMKGVQLLVPHAKLNIMSDILFQHVENLEKKFADADQMKFIRDAVWFAKCLAVIDTLWTYETSTERWLIASLSRLGPKIKYLASLIESGIHE